MPTPLDLLFEDRIGTPGINPNAPDPRPRRSPLDDFFTRPGGRFLANLLAQSGYSTVPSSPLGAIGRAALLSRQQGADDRRAGLNEMLIRSRIGLQDAQARALGVPKQQETFTQLTPDEVRQNGLDPTKAYQRSDVSGRISQIGGSGTVVNVNNEPPIPKDHRAIRDANGNLLRYEVVEGSPTAIAQGKREENVKRESGVLTQEIDRAIANMQPDKGLGGLVPDVGFGSGLASRFSGTDARKVQGNLETIQAQIGFQKLQTMREASPTGGALGQVSEREISFLQAIMGDIKQSQDRETLEFNLNRLWNATQDIVHGEGNGPERRDITPPELVNQNQSSAQERIDAL